MGYGSSKSGSGSKSKSKSVCIRSYRFCVISYILFVGRTRVSALKTDRSDVPSHAAVSDCKIPSMALIPSRMAVKIRLEWRFSRMVRSGWISM